MKSVEIIPPEGYEIDKKNSTFEEIKFKPIKCLTLEDVSTEVIDEEKALAFKKLLQIAKYYNGTWIPNWYKFDECKYYIVICGGEYFITKCTTSPQHFIYFKNKEDAQKVIDNPNFKITLDILYR